MEAGSHSGIARLVQQSLGTSALFPSFLCVCYYIYFILFFRISHAPYGA
jgi:hypothetical protein